MAASQPGPSETLVSSTHGNSAFSDADLPVTISHHSHGALITPPVPAVSLQAQAQAQAESAKPPALLGKIHFALPTLRAPEEKTPSGQLTGLAIVSNALEVCISPHGGGEQHLSQDPEQSGLVGSEEEPLPLHELSKIIRVDLYAGREILGSWGQGVQNEYEHQQQPLPAAHDFRIHIVSVIYGNGENLFNENPKGLGVSLTIEFCGEKPGLIISSVALVQDVVGRGFARC